MATSLDLPSRHSRAPAAPRGRASNGPSAATVRRGPGSASSRWLRAGAPEERQGRRLLLADPHALLLEGLRRLLAGEFEVVGCAHDSASLLREARRLAPDLVLVGTGLPGMDGLSILEPLRSAAPSSRVVVLAGGADPRLASAAFRLGARGVVVRSSSLDELCAALGAARRGERYLTSLVGDGDPASLPGDADAGTGPLTPREREVVRLTAEGRLMKEVGAALGISTRTVAFHKYRAMEKVGARSSAELVRYALRASIV